MHPVDCFLMEDFNACKVADRAAHTDSLLVILADRGRAVSGLLPHGAGTGRGDIDHQRSDHLGGRPHARQLRARAAAYPGNAALGADGRGEPLRLNRPAGAQHSHDE